MTILGIETSCDDTCAALIEAKSGKFRVLKNVVASQAELHKKYGGVVPEVAARQHVETIIPVINEAIMGAKRSSSKNSRPKIDAIAVTSGPGLITSLHVGVETAKALSLAWGLPLISINHIEGHIYSSLLHKSPSPIPRRGSGGGNVENRKIYFPAIALIVSGGHTELILMAKHGKYRLLGRTRDDAAGEAFDKSAKMLNLPYPGGPEISKRAEKGNPQAFAIPRPMIQENNFEFSFSGMKNAIRLLIERLRTDAPSERLSDATLNDLCASIEHAIVDVLTTKSLKAAEKYNPKTFILAGGVAANKKLRQTLKNSLPKKTRLLVPALNYCMDNAAMIAIAGYYHAKRDSSTNTQSVHIPKKNFQKCATLKANANWELVN